MIQNVDERVVNNWNDFRRGRDDAKKKGYVNEGTV